LLVSLAAATADMAASLTRDAAAPATADADAVDAAVDATAGAVLYGVSYSFFLVGPPLDVRLNPCATGPSGILQGSI